MLALALAVRLWGITDRLPDPALRLDPIRDTSIDETDRREVAFAWEMWRGGTRPFDPNPHGGEWPAFSFYVSLLLQVAYRLIHSLTSGAWSGAGFASHVQADPRGLFLAGRLGGVLIGVLSVWVTYLVGVRGLGRATGLLGAGLVAVNAVHILTSQHVSDPNLLALLFVTLAGVALMRRTPAGGVPSVVIAGAMIGLAGASKYVPMALIPLLALGSGISPGDAGERDLKLSWRNLAAGLAAAVVAFFVASPFTFLDWTTTAGDIAAQRERHLSEWLGQTRYVIALPEYLVRILPSMLGWPAYALAAIGAVGVVRNRRQAWCIVLIPALLLLANGLLSVAQPRFMLPALPCLAILAGYAIVRLSDATGRQLGASARVATVVLLGLFAVAAPLRDLAAARTDLSRPDSRRVSRAWIERHIDPAVPIATDVYGPVFGEDENVRAVVTWPFFAEQASLVGIAYRPQWLDGFGYCVISGGVAARYETEREAYPAEWQYFRWLRENASVVWESNPGSMSGPAIEVRRLPAPISTRAARDSIWRLAPVDPRGREQFALWCMAAAQAFLVAGDLSRSEEWAERGLTIEHSSARRALYRTLAFAYLKAERLQELMALTAAALREFPDDDALYLCRGMALEALGDGGRALAAYEESLRLNPGQARAERIRLRVNQLRGLLGAER